MEAQQSVRDILHFRFSSSPSATRRRTWTCTLWWQKKEKRRKENLNFHNAKHPEKSIMDISALSFLRSTLPRPHQPFSDPTKCLTIESLRLIYRQPTYTQTSCTLSGLLCNFWFYAIGVAAAVTSTCTEKFLFRRDWHDFLHNYNRAMLSACEVKIFAYGRLRFFIPCSATERRSIERERRRGKEEEPSIWFQPSSYCGLNYHLELRTEKTVNDAHSSHLFSCFVSKLFSFSWNFEITGLGGRLGSTVTQWCAANEKKISSTLKSKT